MSGHINHIAVANALRTACKAGRLWNQQKLHKPAKLFQLKSTGVIRKHLGVLDVFFSFSDPHFFLMPSGGFIHIWKTMQCHASQFVWYLICSSSAAALSRVLHLYSVRILLKTTLLTLCYGLVSPDYRRAAGQVSQGLHGDVSLLVHQHPCRGQDTFASFGSSGHEPTGMHRGGRERQGRTLEAAGTT